MPSTAPATVTTTELDTTAFEDLVATTTSAVCACEDDAKAKSPHVRKLLADLRPATPAQAVIAAQLVISHYGVIECFRRAANKQASDAVATRLVSKGATLMRVTTNALRALRREQASAKTESRKSEPVACPPPSPAAVPQKPANQPRMKSGTQKPPYLPQLAKPDDLPPEAAALLTGILERAYPPGRSLLRPASLPPTSPAVIRSAPAG